MKSLRVRSAKAQRGSAYTTMILVALFGLVILAALKIAPAYVDDRAIAGTMESMAESNEFADMSIADIRSSLMRTLNTNRIQFDPSNVVLVKEGSREYVDVNYESRKSLFYNIDAVVKFEHRFDKK
ncbi:MAG: DUF4845 domain-containing protein [Gammaproteobacteria bacterium]